MIFGAPIAMKEDIPRTPIRHSGIICCREPQTHWVVLVYHGVASVRSIKSTWELSLHAKDGYQGRKHVLHILSISRTWWQKLSSLRFAPGEDIWFIFCERWGPLGNASAATSSAINSAGVLYTTTPDAVYPHATTVIVYIAAAVCISTTDCGTTAVCTATTI